MFSAMEIKYNSYRIVQRFRVQGLKVRKYEIPHADL
jgi:hypothetical protein